MRKSYVQPPCFLSHEALFIRWSGGIVAGLEYLQLCERSASLGQSEVQNLVLLRTSFVHRLIIIDEGKVPLLMSPPQMKNLGVSLDLRGTPEKIVFHTGFLKGQGVLLHRNRAGHLTLNGKKTCE